MCGIVGVLGHHEAAPILVEALKRLEYRGYDSAGVATVAGTSFGAMGEGFIRFSYANSVENVERALDRFATLLSS